MDILPFDPSQYEALARVLSAAYGSYSFDVENLRYRDDMLGSKYLWRRWAAASDGESVGFGGYSQTPEMSDPNTYLINIAVHPKHQGRGIGTQLYLRICGDLAEHHAHKLRASCRADNNRSVVFLENRGFTTSMSIKELRLGIPATYTSRHKSGSSAPGITIATLQCLESDVNRNRKLFELVTEIRGDMPTPQTIKAVTFNEFVAGFLLAPSRLPEATFIAVNSDTGEYVGFSDLFDDGNSGMMAGLTGVKREYRKRGIATALKQSALRYAEACGFKSITTFNAVENAAITAVNKRLGFIEKFTWLHFEKHVSNG